MGNIFSSLDYNFLDYKKKFICHTYDTSHFHYILNIWYIQANKHEDFNLFFLYVKMLVFILYRESTL